MTSTGLLTLGLAYCLSASASAAEPEEVLLEIHYKPVPNLQIAVWVEDANGKFVQDVFVTQATGKLGIGNRPGIWNFLSSWRAPYGPRVSTLPIWAHRRGKTYPKIVFFDDDASDQDSLGWHENSSSAETYHCRPLTPEEHAVISVDSMTCPSPATFQSDKGRFSAGELSHYPPRNDLLTFEVGQDSDDAMTYSSLNELDAFTGATPPGNAAEFLITSVAASALAAGPITVWIEVNLEDDQNGSWSFSREDDHFVDPKLAAYGVGYLGQPSVVYKVELDARDKGFSGVEDYAGYGDWNGDSGAVHGPDGTIDTSGGGGADRLQLYSLNGETFRFGVYSYGTGPDGPDPTDPTDPTDTDPTSDPTSSTTGDDTDPTDDGWGSCQQRTLAPVEDLTIDSETFDEAVVSFTVPPLPEVESSPTLGELSRVRIYHLNSQMTLTEDMLGAAVETAIAADVVVPGERTTVTVDKLWGNFTYQFGVRYEDKCANKSELSTGTVHTPAQQFQQVE
ncbi:MAG: hypothetical protein KC636_12945, partial [Myxococcales bacterium]|nr:hypothetical protein [Myxococcales bacterium]